MLAFLVGSQEYEWYLGSILKSSSYLTWVIELQKPVRATKKESSDVSNVIGGAPRRWDFEHNRKHLQTIRFEKTKQLVQFYVKELCNIFGREKPKLSGHNKALYEI